MVFAQNIKSLSVNYYMIFIGLIEKKKVFFFLIVVYAIIVVLLLYLT